MYAIPLSLPPSFQKKAYLCTTFFIKYNEKEETIIHYTIYTPEKRGTLVPVFY